jgi:hypothetical protein
VTDSDLVTAISWGFMGKCLVLGADNTDSGKVATRGTDSRSDDVVDSGANVAAHMSTPVLFAIDSAASRILRVHVASLCSYVLPHL